MKAIFTPRLTRVLALAMTALGLAAVAGSPCTALATTGVCDSNPPTSTDACINAIQTAGGVVNDIFHDANGLTATQLPLYGKLFNQWPGCPDVTSFAGCAGIDNPPYDCPGEYTCVGGVANNFANASARVNALDHLWWHPCRLAQGALSNGCPVPGCIADGVGGNYLPWEGLVFDLGGPSNKVAIFAMNDHGPQPCESLEYTVFLSDNPFAQDVVLDPKTTGIDPTKWNRAVLKQIFTHGWEDVRTPDPVGHASCGDTASYAVEEDAFAQVFSLPCGVTFRYAAVVAGNDGRDFPACAFDSQEAELDAVAGLTETGAGVCPDADHDGYVDCNCPSHPPVCDCNDSDPKVHPGAPEACDSPDVNCDGKLSPCATDLVCYQSICIEKCPGAEFPCPMGSSCTMTAQGPLCIPTDCTVGGCPPGGVCKNGICVPACTGVVCPGNQDCQDGTCKDLCANLLCPPGQMCEHGKCEFPCSCFAGNIGCADQPGTSCDPMNAGACVPPLCVGSTCAAPNTCDPGTGMCVPFCNSNVVCPSGEKCVAPNGCVPNCTGVACQAGFACDPKTGMCADKCIGVTCLSPAVCMDGMCVSAGMGGAGGMGSTSSSGTGGTGGSQSTGTGSGHVSARKGCGCRTAGAPDDDGTVPLVLAAAFVMVARRTRRRRL